MAKVSPKLVFVYTMVNILNFLDFRFNQGVSSGMFACIQNENPIILMFDEMKQYNTSTKI